MRFTLDDSKAYIFEKTFRLQPEPYQKSHPDWPGAVGLEIEMLPLRIEEGETPAFVKLQGQNLDKRTGQLAAYLRQIATEQNWNCSESEDDQGQKLLMNVFMEHDDNLSFEPGGQLEFSSKPYECLIEAVKRTIQIQGVLDEGLQRLGNVFLTQVGINPWHSVQELGLQMTKSRYLAMNEFFSRISPYGPRMMRQTCTVQVNLDFGKNETLMGKRYLASLLIAPFIGAIFNNSAVTERKPNGYGGMRSKIWREMDPTRTGVPDTYRLLKTPNKEACVETYFEFVENARIVFIAPLNYRVMHEFLTWKEWATNGYNGLFPTREDFETHLSLLFPEVRARGFLELRSVDCQSRQWQFVPAALWTGLLYNDNVCDQVIDYFSKYAAGRNNSQMNSLLDAACFGLMDDRIWDGAKMLFELAEKGLTRLPGCYYGLGLSDALTAFAERYTFQRKVPADDLLSRLNNDQLLEWSHSSDHWLKK